MYIIAMKPREKKFGTSGGDEYKENKIYQILI